MAVKNKVRALVKAGNSETKKKGGRILEQFFKSSIEQKKLIDEIFVEICGASFTQILEDIKQEERAVEMNTKEQVKEKNDLFRQTMHGFLGKVVFSEGFSLHPKKEDALTLIRQFNDFNQGNDSHQEHDFGAVEIESEDGDFCEKRNKSYQKFFFKIDYYDQKLEFGADPYSGPVRRVLTIMLAEEY